MGEQKISNHVQSRNSACHAGYNCNYSSKEEEGDQREPVLRLGLADRSKRDEWSEGAVASLLDAYEAKWVLRNRAKLKGQDWEDVARAVSARAGAARAPKTPTQCKNKVESMKKRYRSESAAGDGSRWPLFARLDGLVRCRAPGPAVVQSSRQTEPPPPAPAPAPAPAPPPPPPPPPVAVIALPLASGTPSSRSPEEDGGAIAVQAERAEASGGKERPNELSKEINCSMPSSHSSEENQNVRKKKRRSREEGEGWEVLKSIQWLAEVALRIEQARMEAMREVEKMRAQAEARKGEMDLKRTEIIANTQLQIAKLLAGNDDSVDPSLRIARG